jgi:hypothetical protein
VKAGQFLLPCPVNNNVYDLTAISFLRTGIEAMLEMYMFSFCYSMLSSCQIIVFALMVN